MNLETFAPSEGRRVPIRVLARMAATGIYLLRGIPRELQRGARARAVSEGTTVRCVLLQAASLARVRGGNLDTAAR